MAVAAGDRLPAVGVDLGVDRVVDPGSPDTTRALWTEKPSRPGRVSVTWSTALLPVRIRPVSPTWPPPSA